MTHSTHDPVGALQVGARVAVRYRLPERDVATGASLTDVTGTLVSAGPTGLVVETRRGEVVVPRSRVVAAKVIPPRAARRGAPHLALSVENLQRVMVDAWPPIERDHLGDWLLRAGRGFTGRANTALAVGSPGVELAAALTEVQAWYAARGLPAGLVVAGPVGFSVVQDAVAAEALSRGWADRVPTLTLTASTSTVAGAVPGVELSERLSDDWFTALTRYRAADREAVEAVLHGSPKQRFATVRRGGAVIGIGRLGVAHGWGGLGAMWVDPAYRRSGVASAMVSVLASEAFSLGAFSLHLQTDSDNAVALALYRRLGFTRHHSYVYLAAG